MASARMFVVEVPNASELAAKDAPRGAGANDVIAEVVIAVAAASSDALLPTGAAAVGASDDALVSSTMVPRADAARTAGARVSALERRRARGVGAHASERDDISVASARGEERRGRCSRRKAQKQLCVTWRAVLNSYLVRSHLRAHHRSGDGARSSTRCMPSPSSRVFAASSVRARAPRITPHRVNAMGGGRSTRRAPLVGTAAALASDDQSLTPLGHGRPSAGPGRR